MRKRKVALIFFYLLLLILNIAFRFKILRKIMSKIPLADGIFQTKVNITVKSKSARAGFEPSVWLNTGNVSGKILSEEKRDT